MIQNESGSHTHRGDVVVAISPQEPTKKVCKRIIGLPGDRVCVESSPYGRRFAVVRDNLFSLI